MDKAQKRNIEGPAEEESDQYIWLAGALVGGFLILMIIIIIGIIIWMYVKKQKTSIDQNWAGPSPLADGNIQDLGNCVNSSILGRSMSLSHISIVPIFSNDQQTAQEVHQMGGGIQHEHFEEEANENNLTSISTINIPAIPAASTKNGRLASETNISTQITEKGSNYEAFPPTPLDLPQEFPLPPPPGTCAEQDLKGNNMQPFPEMNSHQQDQNGTEEPLNLHLSDMDALHINSNLDDQLLPTPLPNF